MRDKFEKYWDGLLNMNLLVIIASIFDPRNKMQFASLCFEQLYGKGTIETRQLEASVSSVLKKLYDEYSLRLSPTDDGAGNRSDHGDSEQPSVACGMSDDEDDYVGVDVLYDNMVDQRRSEECFSELDIYLAEKTELKVDNSLGLPYDVLDWWRCNTSKFPILSQLASDVLAIQVSSVASEYAFSTSGRVLDPYRSSLTPYMIEVLLCLQQWLRCSYQSQANVANLVQMLEEENFLDSLDSWNSIAPSQ
ncbi:zinc finger BED domain-containing protein RICESLEEPER 2 [Arabidopsis lyrata subsp. lyrata]|uniref:zinc finger BED domain-containing protein RICESLEEPER 2 n=1 Tax=Arabidopsis lyrata subsp. lyrata TaxID=81972 RepID=UPI000A29AB39|nr:zinc finger BED domain-containing protein RICESLEEPER 2 [Arabidopsis lyrata subsp. lyrata]XP_020883970.1 zinc finger BED domain-containing protein RICESLEEPER 2 [Arabidopsis lyrata subsp. lyrata]|eukprot:XP_020883969.1 zinc finger BED domain-containing protein RICESLEEPER 2 [Arabidopsis lyrata subsp. lyrata]